MVERRIPPADVHERWPYWRSVLKLCIGFWASVFLLGLLVSDVPSLLRAWADGRATREEATTLVWVGAATLLGCLATALWAHGLKQRAEVKALIQNRKARHFEYLAQIAWNLKEHARCASGQNLNDYKKRAADLVLTAAELGGFDFAARAHIKARVLHARRERQDVLEAALAATLSPVAVAHPVTDPDVFRRGCEQLAADVLSTLRDEGWRPG